MKISAIGVVLLVLPLLSDFARAGSPSFNTLAVGGRNSSGRVTRGTALRFSDDGSVLIGRTGSGNAALGNFGYRATLGSGAPVLSKITDGVPADISADGSVTVGGTTAATTFRRAGGSVTLLHPAGFASSSAQAVSADGSVVAGIAGNNGFHQPWRWTAAAGTQAFDLPEATSIYGSVKLARDGSAIFAQTVSSLPTIGGSAASTYGLSRWDASGVRTEILPPAGYVFNETLPNYSLSTAGSALMLVRKINQTSPYPVTALSRWAPEGASVIPLPEVFGHGEGWLGVVQSGDGSVFVASSARTAVRYAGGVFTDIGPFHPSFVNGDGSVILGTMQRSRQLAVWTAATGLVDVSEKLTFQLAPTIIPPRLSSAIFGIRGENLLFAGQIGVTGSVGLAEIPVAALAEAEGFTGDLLAAGTQTIPSATFTEKASRRGRRVVVPAEDGFPGFSYLEPVETSSAKLQVTASMEGVEINSIDANTPVEMWLGTLRIFKGKLNDDTQGGFSPGDTAAQLGDLTIKWNATSVTFEVLRSTLAGQVTGSLPLRLLFGARSGKRDIYFTGTYTDRSQSDGDEGTFLTYNLSAKGSFIPPKLRITAKLPKNGAVFHHRHLQLPGLESSNSDLQIWMRQNGGEWAFLGTGAVIPPPILLAEGANTVEIEGRPPSGAAFPLFRQTYIYQPKGGAYTALLVEDEAARGFLTILLTEDGAFSGKLNLDGKAFVVRGALDAAGHAEIAVKRSAKTDPLALALDLQPGAEANVLSVSLTIPQPPGPSSVATGSGGRANWNAPLHPSLVTASIPFVALLQPRVDAPANVTGSGYLTLTLQKGSVFKGVGKLADGTPFSGSFPLDDQLRVPVFLRLPGGNVGLSGTLVFNFAEPSSDLSGALHWRRDPSAGGAFAAGWQSTLGVVGSAVKYSSDSSMNLLRFSGGGLEGTRLLDRYYYLQKDRLITVQYTASGIMKGKFKDIATGKSYPYEATMISKTGQVGGFFVTPMGSGKVTAELSNGIEDGPAEVARFNAPTGLAFDSFGNLFVVDSRSHTIRKIDSAGNVSTFAGRALYSGTADGAGVSARLHAPTALAVDASDHLFVADTENYTLRRITPAGVVTTFAGTAKLYGTTDGVGAAAGLGRVDSLAFSGTELYLHGEGRLRRVTPGADVSTVNPGFFASALTAADSNGNLFFSANGQVQKIDTAGNTVTNLAGDPLRTGFKDGRGAAARFSTIGGIVVDESGNVFVSDTNSAAIRKIAPDGTVTTFAGRGGYFGRIDGAGAGARFNEPRGLTLDSAGNLYVADTANHCIRKITPTGTVTTFAGPR